MEENKNIFNKSHFSRNIKSLFNKESKNNYYNKHRLNVKLKSLIIKEKSLNDRKIIDFNYGEMFHFFKADMKKFDDAQLKRKNFYKTLYEENTKFNKEYQKNYSLDSKLSPKYSKPKIKSKTFQKFYDKHQIEDTSKKVNNLFNRDPLLVSNNDIKLFYMTKDIPEDEGEYKDDALDYVEKLENNINRKSILNKMRNAIKKYERKKSRKLMNLKKDKDFPFIDKSINNDDKNKNKIKSLKKEIIPNIYYKKYSMDLRKYNNNIKEMLSKLNESSSEASFKIKNNDDYYHYNNKKNYFKNIFNETENENQKTNYFSSYSENINKKIFNFNNKKKKKKENKSSNQIESLYNELFKIKKNINKYEKKNESGLRYLYTFFSNNPGKKFKQSLIENQRLIKLDKQLVYSVNSFND